MATANPPNFMDHYVLYTCVRLQAWGSPPSLKVGENVHTEDSLPGCLVTETKLRFVASEAGAVTGSPVCESAAVYPSLHLTRVILLSNFHVFMTTSPRHFWPLSLSCYLIPLFLTTPKVCTCYLFVPYRGTLISLIRVLYQGYRRTPL